MLRAPALEKQARCEDEIVIVRVEFGRRDLHACAGSDRGTAVRICRVELEFAEGDSRRQKVLRLAVVLAAVEPRRIRLQFRPHELADFILSRGVPGYAAAQLHGISGRQRTTDRGDDIESAKALPA